jgi:hypothetical protein
MKIVIVLFLMVVLPVAAMAADYPDTCTAWNQANEDTKHSFLHGWLAAVEAAGPLTKAETKSRLWPEGFRVGRMRSELDATCKIPENRNRPIGIAITEIAGQKKTK